MSVSRRSDSDIGEPEVGTDDDMDCGDEAGGGGREEVWRQLFSSDMSWWFSSFLYHQVNSTVKKEEEGTGSKPASMFQMMNHIQSLISMAVENAKQEEKSISHQKSEFTAQTIECKY